MKTLKAFTIMQKRTFLEGKDGQKVCTKVKILTAKC